MKFAIIISKQDPAGMKVKEFLDLDLLKENNTKLHLIEERTVFSENLDEKIEADMFIFATTHRSEKGVPSLCVHSPGNWGIAELGGQTKKLCVAPALYLRSALIKLIELNEQNKLDFDVVQECTHHGPFLGKPAMFIEIGSTEKEWKNSQAGKIIADTIHHLISNKPEEVKIGFGIGGLHTTPNFKKLVLGNVAIGHVCPKYMLEHLDENLIKQAILKTYPKNDLVILDWKGLKDQKKKIIDILDELNIEYTRTKDF